MNGNDDGGDDDGDGDDGGGGGSDDVGSGDDDVGNNDGCGDKDNDDGDIDDDDDYGGGGESGPPFIAFPSFWTIFGCPQQHPEIFIPTSYRTWSPPLRLPYEIFCRAKIKLSRVTRVWD